MSATNPSLTILKTLIDTTTTIPNTNNKPTLDPRDEDLLDDNMSMCSSQSSGASDRSVGKTRKKVRRIRCEIHSKKSKKSSSIPENPDGQKKIENKNDNANTNANNPVCTCSNSGAGRPRRRPEPEGGCLINSVSGGKTTINYGNEITLLEIDKILYSNEPLFSDVEDEGKTVVVNGDGDGFDLDADNNFSNNSNSNSNNNLIINNNNYYNNNNNNNNSRNVEKQTSNKFLQQRQQQKPQETIDEQIKRESDRFHKRLERSAGGSSTSLETIFSSVQMLNTNTSIKFAILQTELKNIKDRSLKRMETDTNSVLNRFTEVDETLTNSKNLLSTFSADLQQTSKSIEAIVIKELEELRSIRNSRDGVDLLTFSIKRVFCDEDVCIIEEKLSHLERNAKLIEADMKNSVNVEEKRQLTIKLEKVLDSDSKWKKVLLRVHSCLE